MLKKINNYSLLLFTFLMALPKLAHAGNPTGSVGSFNTMFGGTCDDYACWIGKVWSWSIAILIPLSVVVISAAGVIYMTSEGDPGRMGLAKKMLVGVFSGVGLIILARVLLVNVLGLGTSWNV